MQAQKASQKKQAGLLARPWTGKLRCWLIDTIFHSGALLGDRRVVGFVAGWRFRMSEPPGPPPHSTAPVSLLTANEVGTA